MSMIKRYFDNIICQSADQIFGQEAVEWAIVSGHVTLTYDQSTDLKLISDQYSEIIDAYQAELRKNQAALVGSYEHAGLLEEILRPVPLQASAQPQLQAA